MRVLIALLRGINVGGKNRLPMKELVSMLEELGARSVRTYIQSGQVVFESGDEDLSGLAREIGARIASSRGFEPHVLVLEREDLESAIDGNPFPEAEEEPKFLHLGFLDSVPEHPDLEALTDLKRGSERFHLAERVFYLYAPEGVGRSKLAARAERLLGVPMTDRNWRTVRRLQEMARELT